MGSLSCWCCFPLGFWWWGLLLCHETCGSRKKFKFWMKFSFSVFTFLCMHSTHPAPMMMIALSSFIFTWCNFYFRIPSVLGGSAINCLVSWVCFLTTSFRFFYHNGIILDITPTFFGNCLSSLCLHYYPNGSCLMVAWIANMCGRGLRNLWLHYYYSIYKWNLYELNKQILKHKCLCTLISSCS